VDLIVGQVPAYLLIGNGRVARHVACYFDHLGLSCTQWHRGMPEETLAAQAAAASHILILIRDDAIADFAQFHLSGVSALKIHFSGALVAAGIHGAHPLMTFGPDLYAPEKYAAIPFVIEDDAPDFAALLPGLPNAHARIKKNDKAKYHALCAMAGNFSCLLWQKLM
jgi:2-dehydropantoate 2-reductase